MFGSFAATLKSAAADLNIPDISNLGSLDALQDKLDPALVDPAEKDGLVPPGVPAVPPPSATSDGNAANTRISAAESLPTTNDRALPPSPSGPMKAEDDSQVANEPDDWDWGEEPTIGTKTKPRPKPKSKPSPTKQPNMAAVAEADVVNESGSGSPKPEPRVLDEAGSQQQAGTAAPAPVAMSSAQSARPAQAFAGYAVACAHPQTHMRMHKQTDGVTDGRRTNRRTARQTDTPHNHSRVCPQTHRPPTHPPTHQHSHSHTSDWVLVWQRRTQT